MNSDTSKESDVSRTSYKKKGDSIKEGKESARMRTIRRQIRRGTTTILKTPFKVKTSQSLLDEPILEEEETKLNQEVKTRDQLIEE